MHTARPSVDAARAAGNDCNCALRRNDGAPRRERGGWLRNTLPARVTPGCAKCDGAHMCGTPDLAPMPLSCSTDDMPSPVCLSWAWLARRASGSRNTYGYGKATVLAALAIATAVPLAPWPPHSPKRRLQH